MAQFNLTFKGDKEIAAALSAVPVPLRERWVPIALRWAGAAIVREARKRVPVDKLTDPSGLLKKSLGLLLRGRRGKVKYIAFGARTGFAQMTTRPVVIGGEIKGRSTRLQNPAFIAHLVEFGHFVVVPKKGTSIRQGNAITASGKTFVAARPFLRPAMMASRSEVRTRIIRSLQLQLQKHFLRGVKKLARSA